MLSEKSYKCPPDYVSTFGFGDIKSRLELLTAEQIEDRAEDGLVKVSMGVAVLSIAIKGISAYWYEQKKLNSKEREGLETENEVEQMMEDIGQGPGRLKRFSLDRTCQKRAEVRYSGVSRRS